MPYSLIMSDDEIPTIVGDGLETIGRALTRKDGLRIVEELNKRGADVIRQKILDAIEECFDA